ncbi:MAG TPA: phenylalanine--tRNA ligase subunit alpha [Acidimicrobiia bacterium]|nr:phenylalanine--tRNA ligase subunit alpha [Acidimicrobiia bacterium]
MSVPDRLREIEHDGLARLAAAATVADLDALREELLGDGSEVAVARRGLRDASPDERKVVGSAVNGVTRAITGAIEDRRAELAATEEQARLETERVDMTLPGRAPALGTHHLVMQVWEEIVDIFVGLGYSVASGPEVETAFYNFDALNTPPTHPARLESDTLYVAHGSDPEGVLLRTQTSPVQARYMEQHDPPVYIVAPGRTYRRDQTDATHTPVFHQMEGLAVDSDITFADLKGTLHYFAREFFGPSSEIRFLPNFFPFTEPSAEMHVSCFACDGSGCRTCGRTGWIELLGCGVVDPNVFEAVGYDPTEVSGFAFGVGIDRLALIRYGVPELRLFFDPDARVSEQYR